MTAEKDDIGVSISRRHIMAASMIGTLAGAAGLAGTAVALASEASGQRGHPIVRAHSASEDERKRAGDTRPEPGSSARAPALANDSTKGLTTPIPPQAPMTEGIADLGNVKLWYWDTGGTGEAVVFLHPGSGSGEFYPYQQPAFAKAGYRAISYSRRGQNKSETGTDADTYFAADDLLNLMTYLKIDKFHAVGNALGGYIGLDIAMSHPDRLRSLTLACSMMGISEPEFAKVLQSLRPKAFGDLPMEVKELGPSYRAANPEGVSEWKKLHDRSGTRSPVRLRNKFTWQTLATLKVPTLLVTGDADLWIPPYLLRQVGEKIPNSKVVIVADSGHGVQWEQPEIFNNTVLDFIRASAVR